MASQHGLKKFASQVKPFSKLFISGKYASVAKVAEPELRLKDHLNDEYLDKVKRSLMLRGVNRNGLGEVDFKQLKKNVRELLDRKEKSRILRKEGAARELIEVEWERIFALEKEVIPIVLRLPNLFDENEVPTEGYEDEVVKMTKTRQYDFKLLDARRISYINGLRKSSILGPHCEYLLGKGAQITLAAQKYFRHVIQQQFPEKIAKKMKHRHLHESDGLDLVKSGSLEAFNDYENLNYETDSLQLDLKEREDQQQLHLIGSCSPVGLLSLLSNREIDKKCLPARMIKFGSSYEQNLRQVNTIFLFSIVENDFTISNNEFKTIQRLIWHLYEPFNLPMRLKKVNLKRLLYNEYKRVELDIYFPYAREWRTIAHFSHYSNHLPERVQCTENHCMSGNLTDLGLLLDAILENYQTQTGKIEIPECIEKYM